MKLLRNVTVYVLFCIYALCICIPAEAEVTRIDIREQTSFNDGAVYGDIGPYEVLSGKVYYEVDPDAAANSTIIDLGLASRNRNGCVAFSADFMMILPVDRSKVNGTMIYEVNNRGNRLLPLESFLLNRGYVFVYSGWIAELLPDSKKLRMYAPVAGTPEHPLTGLVSAEMVTSKPITKLNINGGGHGAYEPTEQGVRDAVLTVRETEKASREPVPRADFSIETSWDDYTGEPDGLPRVEVVLNSGFKPGYIYELIYEAKNPVVQGLCFAGIRDLVSYFRYDTSENNPLTEPDTQSRIARTVGFGISQSGRCLRMFLCDGFNADEHGRQVFDGVLPIVAGGGLGYFNHRFASPTRTNSQHESHTYPVDVFPFTYGNEYDPLTGRTDGILNRSRKSGTVPKILHFQTSAEYWQRSGSLVHTDPLGKKDAVIPPEVRIYAVGGSRHGSGDGTPRPRTNGQLQDNPTKYNPLMTTLVITMDEWLSDGTQPPPSRYPRIDDGTLTGWHENEIGWDGIPGVPYPKVIQQAEVFDYGPDFYEKRITVNQPPDLIGTYPALVPAVGADNNELGMILPPNVGVPLATYTGWNLRAESVGAKGEILWLRGSYIPFKQTRQERLEADDPRPAIYELYMDFDDYLSKYTAYTRDLVNKRFLIEDDVEQYIEMAKGFRNLFDK